MRKKLSLGRTALTLAGRRRRHADKHVEMPSRLRNTLLNLTRDPSAAADRAIDGQRLRRRGGAAPACQTTCGGVCAPLTCCG